VTKERTKAMKRKGRGKRRIGPWTKGRTKTGTQLIPHQGYCECHIFETVIYIND